VVVNCPQCRSEIRLTDLDPHQRVLTYLCSRCAEIVHIDLILDAVDRATSETSFKRIRQGRTILVADDSAALCHVAVDILNAEGHQVLVAANGEEALDQVQRHHPDLVVMGLMVRGIGAVELLRRLRRDDRIRNTPVLIMSRIAKPELVHSLAAQGAAGFLDEERLVETLVFRVQQVLDQATGASPSPLAP
jgi:CheY-like chemotaxis protein